MFDGTSVLYVSEKITLDISFPSGEIHNILFFVAPLDSSCEAVLGLNWLVKYNPLVDWTTRRLTFRAATSSAVPFPIKSTSASSHPIAARAASLSDPSPDIRLINAAAFYQATQLEGSRTFFISYDSLRLRHTNLSDEVIDLSNIPDAYHDFSDVFSKCRADSLPEHRPYDL